MKSSVIKLAFVFILLFQQLVGQTFLNGDFENNTSTTCDYNLSDVNFNSKMANVFAFGKTSFNHQYVGETDIMTNNCYGNPQHGNWCISLASDYESFTTSDAVAIELSTSLSAGHPYQLSFYMYGNTSITTTTTNIRVGESLTDSTFGVLIDTVSPIVMTWKHVTLNFTATQASKFITVKNVAGIAGWNQIDNFTFISLPTGLEDLSIAGGRVNVFPNPSSNFVSIQTDPQLKFISATLKNTLGEMILTEQSQTLDLSMLPSGQYFVEVLTDSGKRLSRIVKQ